jgi:hypothetical protein
MAADSKLGVLVRPDANAEAASRNPSGVKGGSDGFALQPYSRRLRHFVDVGAATGLSPSPSPERPTAFMLPGSWRGEDHPPPQLGRRGAGPTSALEQRPGGGVLRVLDHPQHV